MRSVKEAYEVASSFETLRLNFLRENYVEAKKVAQNLLNQLRILNSYEQNNLNWHLSECDKRMSRMEST